MLCLSQARTRISNAICRGLFFVHNGLKWHHSKRHSFSWMVVVHFVPFLFLNGGCTCHSFSWMVVVHFVPFLFLNGGCTFCAIPFPEWWLYILCHSFSWMVVVHFVPFLFLNGGCTFCWYWWNILPSLYKLFFHNKGKEIFQYTYCAPQNNLIILSCTGCQVVKVIDVWPQAYMYHN